MMSLSRKTCPKCGSSEISCTVHPYCKCYNCGHKWEEWIGMEYLS